MARFTNDRFFGIAPKIPARALAPGIAQDALNADLSLAVQLHPLKGNRYVRDMSALATGTARSLHLYEETHWFEFAGDVDVAISPLPEDDTARVYFTDDDFPKVSRNDMAISGVGVMPAASYRLGVPAPVGSPTVVKDAIVNSEETYNTSYVYTYVTAWGEEGPPSPPSATIEVAVGQWVYLGFTPPPGGAYQWQLIRIYRLNTGNFGSEYQYVDEVLSSEAGYTDKRLNDELAEVLPSDTWYRPPDDTYPTGPLQGLLSLPNGSLAGFTGQTLCISVPYLPHAWPFDSRYPIDRDIVAMARVPRGLVLLTDAHPYLATGTDPSAISVSPMPANQACLSKRSVVDMGGYAIYASPEGLVAIDGTTAKVVTASMFTEEEWRDRFVPGSIEGYFWENRYIGFYDNGVEPAGFIFNPGDEAAAFVPISLHATAGYFDAVSDQLYLNVDGELVIFSHPDEGAIPYVWHSRTWRADMPTPMGAIRLLGDGTVTATVYADGASIMVANVTVTGEKVLRLPSGYRVREWSVKLTGTALMESFDVVTSVMELVQ